MVASVGVNTVSIITLRRPSGPDVFFLMFAGGMV